MTLDVAAAVIERRDGGYLLAERPAGKVYEGWWEFPGGKVEPGESPAGALARELEEELGIVPRCAYPWITREFEYSHARVRLHFFRVTEWQGVPRPRERQRIHWQMPGKPLVEPMLPANAPVLASLSLPLEYAITAAHLLGEAPMLELAERRFRDGLRMVCVREPPQIGAAFRSAMIAIARRHRARVLAKDPVPGVDGLHLSAADLRGSEFERRPGRLLAASVHDREELALAVRVQADFAVLGPVRQTPSHPDGHPLGWEGFRRIAQGTPIPVYAIGGLSRSDLHEARAEGAHGIAMIRGAWRTD